MPDFNASVVLSGILIVSLFVLLSIVGLILFQKVVSPRMRFSEETNNDVIFFASAIGVFYSLVIGLIAVEVWTTYDQTKDIISEEAASTAALYRDVSGLPEPLRAQLQNDLRAYLAAVIEETWPAQQRGEISDTDARLLDRFEDALYTFEPKTLGQQAVYSEALREYNQMIDARRLRIDSAGSTLPSVMWAIVMIGAVLAITVTYLLKIEQPTQILLTAFLALFVGLVIFVVFGLDSPLSGPLAIGPDSYQIVLDRL